MSALKTITFVTLVVIVAIVSANPAPAPAPAPEPHKRGFGGIGGVVYPVSTFPIFPAPVPYPVPVAPVFQPVVAAPFPIYGGYYGWANDFAITFRFNFFRVVIMDLDHIHSFRKLGKFGKFGHGK